MPTTRRDRAGRRRRRGDRGGKPLSLREQANRMKPLGFECLLAKGELLCTGEIQPIPVSARYRVEIRLRAGDRPRVRVLSPKLERRLPGEPIPHTWAPDAPCFYYPVARDWMPSMAMSTSVVPWLGLWLVHYEGWRATGLWEGGGVPHGPRSRSPEGAACPRS